MIDRKTIVTDVCDQQNYGGSPPLVPYRRINLFGGPGAGKSTTAHWIMWRMKSLGLNAEMSREWIKRWAYAGRPIDRDTDQLLVMGRQVEEETEALATKCTVVTDSPILLQAAYAQRESEKELCIDVARDLHDKYPSVNVYLFRGDRAYNTSGRWQSREEAEQKDRQVHDLLLRSAMPFVRAEHSDYDRLWKIITKQVTE